MNSIFAIVFVDLEKAYGKVPNEDIERFEEIGVPILYVRVIQAIEDEVRTSVKYMCGDREFCNGSRCSPKVRLMSVFFFACNG